MRLPTVRKTDHHDGRSYARTLCKLNVFPCVDGLEYPYPSPASCRRRRKGNRVPGGKTGTDCDCEKSGPPGWKLDGRLTT
jgi:hypothetical protein